MCLIHFHEANVANGGVKIGKFPNSLTTDYGKIQYMDYLTPLEIFNLEIFKLFPD